MAVDVAFYPIQVVKGDDFSLTFTRNLKDCTGALTPVNLSSVSSVKAELVGLDGVVDLVFTASVTDATNGEITISLTDTQTSGLIGSSVSKSTEKIGSYYVRLTWASGKIETILRGTVSLLSVVGN